MSRSMNSVGTCIRRTVEEHDSCCPWQAAWTQAVLPAALSECLSAPLHEVGGHLRRVNPYLLQREGFQAFLVQASNPKKLAQMFL